MRQCGECTECCKGWLTASINGHAMFPGRKCHFLSKECTIYENRPDDPCGNYRCEWLNEEKYPEWMRPDLSKIIVTARSIGKSDFYLEFRECGEKMDSEILNWIYGFLTQQGIKGRIQINGGWTLIGPEGFDFGEVPT